MCVIPSWIHLKVWSKVSFKCCCCSIRCPKCVHSPRMYWWAQGHKNCKRLWMPEDLFEHMHEGWVSESTIKRRLYQSKYKGFTTRFRAMPRLWKENSIKKRSSWSEAHRLILWCGHVWLSVELVTLYLLTVCLLTEQHRGFSCELNDQVVHYLLRKAKEINFPWKMFY